MIRFKSGKKSSPLWYGQDSFILNTIRSCLVHPKDKVTKDEQAGVVYQIQCSDCDAASQSTTAAPLQWVTTLTSADTQRSPFSTRRLIGSTGG